MALDYSPKLWEVLNTFSSDARKNALAKCTELGLDPNKGEVPLQESFINLEAITNILRDAVQKEKLIQFPISVQKEIFTIVESISRFLASLNSGADQVVNLVNSIEQLNATIWRYRLQNFSDRMLGFETKMNQLKQQDLEAAKLRDQLEEGLVLKQNIETLLKEGQAAQEKATKALEAIESKAERSSTLLDTIDETARDISTHAKTVTESESATASQLAQAKASLSEIVTLETRIKKFHEEIDDYSEKITQTASTADTAVAKNTKETKDLIEELRNLEQQIKTQVEKATGYSLFHSFQTRQENVARAKNRWVYALFTLVGLSICLAAYLAYTMKDSTALSVAFFLKLSMSIPLIFSISFCTLQYARERKLEEEYAFKSAISISLDPYQSLVQRIIPENNPEERGKFTSFILDAIQKVFTSPTDKIFEPRENSKNLNLDKSLKQVAAIAGSFAKAAKP